MPPICWHLVTVREASAQIDIPAVQEHPAWFLLGATSPDIRVISPFTRAQTHFFDIDLQEQESGTQRIFEQHPGLLRAALTDGHHQAFVAGYLTHLVMDELWITSVYRPLFGGASPLAEDDRRNLLDRIVQFGMDRRQRLDRELMGDIKRTLQDFTADGGIGFLDEPLLRRWHEVIGNLTDQLPEWEVFGRLAGRFFPNEDKEEIVRQAPDLLERAMQHVTEERLVRFRAEAITRSQQMVQGYFS